ncbi:hypothetical protein [Clostridium formicaceticum]|uniref:Uncharacterized protein n=1 Tax=Clostridium formicaceticum TaxID=1497 RepID=A0AAC9RLW9_9CLOT|nr:hypothetical protein [Clostridium formicaceticum]AOY77205.1 hypothetical protein BJL90_15925 [Clostridium formicaceticum]ARE87730.1 hypothetical protein CLFO_21300 [Clostridium formicaceticum]
MAKIGEQLKYKDRKTYNELKQLCKSKEKIQLGDRPENLMKHDSHKRVGRRMRQVKWGDGH